MKKTLLTVAALAASFAAVTAQAQMGKTSIIIDGKKTIRAVKILPICPAHQKCTWVNSKKARAWLQINNPSELNKSMYYLKKDKKIMSNWDNYLKKIAPKSDKIYIVDSKQCCITKKLKAKSFTRCCRGNPCVPVGLPPCL